MPCYPRVDLASCLNIHYLAIYAFRLTGLKALSILSL
jgi:hypothetical protein